MAPKRKGGVSEQTFGAFLAEQGRLDARQDDVVKEFIADRVAVAMEGR